jgi:uncharacterized protein (TIGR02246 family)
MRFAIRVGSLLVSVLWSAAADAQVSGDPAREVRAAEAAFARTMAERDLEAFASFLAEEAVFVGSSGTLRGAGSIRPAWSGFFEAESAPFSWQPGIVEVLDSGTLALSSGPVFDPAGQRIGTFNSVWRREADGRWRIVFDKGCPPCDCTGGG